MMLCMMLRMKIRYGILKPNQISDRVIVKNPNYGQIKIEGWGSRSVVPDAPARIRHAEFYKKLEQSILAEGFRNPIFCNSFSSGTYCRYGTSRLWIAKGKSLEIPCVIADYVDRWVDLEELKTEEEIRSKFTDQPEIIEWEPEFRIDRCPHAHLSK